MGSWAEPRRSLEKHLDSDGECREQIAFSISWIQPKDNGLAINFFHGDLELALPLPAHRLEEVFHADP